MKIQSIDKNIEAILQSGYYRIPRFQRPYSWTKENVEEFLKDTLDDPVDYFIGSIVVFKDTAEKRYGIVDGQQRMTTIAMMLSATRNAFIKAQEPNLALGIHNYIERTNVENHKEFILFPDTSYPYFHEVILSYPSDEESVEITIGSEEELLKGAYELIEETIDKRLEQVTSKSQMSKKAKKEAIKTELERIRDAILNINLIFIEVDNEDDSYVIFETLNTRGRDLAVTDLIKDFLARHIPRRSWGVDRFLDRWNDIMKVIDESSGIESDNFFLHFWLSRYQYVNLKGLYKAIKRTITASEALAFLGFIENDIKLYRTAVEPDYRTWMPQEAELRNALAALNLFRIKQPLPLVLGILRAYADEKISLRSAKRHLALLENFHFLFSVITSHRSSGGMSTMYAVQAEALFKGRTEQKRADALKVVQSKLKSKWIDFDEFSLGFAELKYSKKYPKQKNLIKYILSKIDKEKSQSGRSTDYAGMTIEHLAPQSGLEGCTDLDIANIGNLILVDAETNQLLANKSFADKVKILKARNIWIDDVLARTRVWNKAAIEKRANELAKIAHTEIWR